jgi:hypothetical protein
VSEFNNKKFLSLDSLLSFRREDQYESTLPQKAANEEEL